MSAEPLLAAFGEAVVVDVPAGATLVVEVVEGRQLADVAIAGLHQGLTRNAAGWARFRRPSLAIELHEGDALLDGDGVPLGRVVEAGGGIDATYPGCWREIYPDGRPGCRDLLADALGVARASLPGVLSAFGAPARLADGGIHGWESADAEPGRRIALRAEVPLRAAVSACPDDEIPGTVRGTLRIAVEGER